MSHFNLSSSFVQSEKFSNKSERFQVIQPSAIAEVLTDHGFDLVHLKTGKAKNAEKADFQTTVARYRSRDAFEIEGLSMDLIFKVPHLYGALTAVLGLFRGICSNQLAVGTHFETIKVRHSGNPLELLNQMIPQLVDQREKLVETIQLMRARDVTPGETLELAKSMARIRLNDVENIDYINFQDLLKPRREEDVKGDLFSAFNVIQENLTRYGLSYQTKKVIDGREVTRNMKTRRLNEYSSNVVDFNGSIFDEAIKLIA